MKLVAVVAYYKPAYVYGGPVRSTAALYEGLAKLGVDVTVITTDANGEQKLDVPLLTPIDVDGVQVIYCPTKPGVGSAFHSPSLIVEAKRYIPQADIVNLQTFWGYATRPLTRYCVEHQIPYFVSLRGQLMDYAMKQVRWSKRLKKRIFLRYIGYQYLNHAVALHCTSTLEIAHLQAYPVTAPTFLVPNSLDVETFAQLPPRGQLRSLYHIPEDALVLVVIGRIHSVKNPHIAVETLAAVQTLPIEVHLLMVGPDEHHLQAALEEQARQAGCADKLHFTGLLQQDDLLQVLADSDLFLMPSQTENFGMSAVEAMAAGVPILVSEGVPVGKWAKQAGAGLMLPCTSSAFADATRALLTDTEKLHQMAIRGRELAATHFDNISVARQMLTQLRAIIETGQPCIAADETKWNH